MYALKQSTAITVQFFAHDANGDGVTGIADGSWTKRISKDGGAFAAMTVTISEMENGWYSIPLSTSHTDTLGFLAVSLSAAAAKRVNLQWRVFVRILDDLAFPNTSGRGMDVDATGGVEITANQNVNVNQWLTATPNVLIGGRVDANAQVVGDKTGYSLTSAQEDAIVDKNWDELKSAHTVADSFGDYLDDEITSRSSHSAADVWAVGTRTLTAFSFAVDISAAAVTLIWDKATSALTTAGSIGKLLVDNINATISSRSSHTAADVWTSGTRTLTSFGTLVVDVWANATRTITGGTITTNSDKTGYSLTAAEEDAIADALLKRDWTAITGEASRSVLNALRHIRNKWSIAGTTLTVTKEDDTTTAYTAALTVDATADPITASDPS